MSTPSTPGSTPKTMSSRLLTMKFMQRASAMPTPHPSAAAAPETTPSPKRRKLNASSPASSPASDGGRFLIDHAAVQAALAAEEAKCQLALEKAAAESGDTRWVLNFEGQDARALPSRALRVVQTGFADLDSSTVSPGNWDSEAEEEMKPVTAGRRGFGKFYKAPESAEYTDDSTSEAEVEEDPTLAENDPAAAQARAARKDIADMLAVERKAQKRAARAQADELARKRKQQEVNLNGLTSLSGGGGGSKASCFVCGGDHLKKDCPKRQRLKAAKGEGKGKECFNCGGDHLKKFCPLPKRGYSGDDDGPSRKMVKTEDGIETR